MGSRREESGDTEQPGTRPTATGLSKGLRSAARARRPLAAAASLGQSPARAGRGGAYLNPCSPRSGRSRAAKLLRTGPGACARPLQPGRGVGETSRGRGPEAEGSRWSRPAGSRRARVSGTRGALARSRAAGPTRGDPGAGNAQPFPSAWDGHRAPGRTQAPRPAEAVVLGGRLGGFYLPETWFLSLIPVEPMSFELG